MEKKKIFLASSSELKNDREQFEIYINRKNKELVNQEIFLELVVWEDFLDAMSQSRLQDEYNNAIRECDIFVMLIFTKVGKYTNEEFETAFGQFKQTNKPLIFTYFKDAEITTGSANRKDMMSLFAFQEKLNSLGHFHTVYKNIDELKYKFNQQLDKLAKEYKGKQLLDGTEKEDDRRKAFLDDQKSSVYRIHAEKVSIGNKEEKLSKNVINIGKGATFHGDFMVGNKIKDSFNKADTSDAPDELKELLKSLSTEVAKMAEQLPKDQAERVAKNLETFTNEATSEKPDREWWELSAKGLKEAGKIVGDVGVSVAKTIAKITPSLDKIS